MESMTNHLFTQLKEVCLICRSNNIYKINGMIVCSDYLILKKAGQIKETIRPLKRIK